MSEKPRLPWDAKPLQSAARPLGSAERLDEFLSARWLPLPGAIISGIAFSTLPPAVSRRVAAAVARVLQPGGRFVAYQVRGHVSRFMAPRLGPPHRS